ncbi:MULTISPECIES: tetratricopeptide repeat protein [unclassified Streptomyces]|uniref:tetratricopeptide repeat protein n=1 Tax=unclassified Streptomyces TaxID=2593676 RepID=UPI0023659BD8|nr:MULTISPECIES: tetratricopeptide repeat protein [unclassified Streptomyces]MDF3141768.1 tetratricopeptide repeat protein [Streptomyces sp. T21Q-yed]WDF38671.1 tetratricopeptide repeat protein [Streptomyces sp. T12]
MATELEELRDALMRAMIDSRGTSQRVLDPLMRSSIPGAVDLWIRTAGIASMDSADARDWVGLLSVLRRNHPQEFSDLKAIAAEHATPAPPPTSTASGVTAGGPRSVVADGVMGVALTGGNDPVVIGGITPHVAGDHIDFRDSTFRDRVVGVQHNHYGTVPAPAEWRPVGDVGPREFGVRPTRPVPGLPDVPPYVPRDRDEDLRTQLAGNSLVLILGEPCVGKSYTAWHGVRSLEGHRLYAPDPGEDLRPLAATLKGSPGKYVVWLDELTGHLGAGGLDLRLLGRINDLGAVVLATMSPDEYYRRRAGTAPGDRVVAAARTVELGREWSEAELARLAALDDRRAYPAYMWSGREGVASYFGVGHHLFDEWRRVGTQLEHPRGQLLVRAAVDLARCGVTGAVPVELLRRVQELYRVEERESFEDALAWATAPMFGVSGLLVAGEEDGTWRAYGALVSEALRSGGDLEPVPDEVWWTLLDAAREPGAALDFAAVLDAARAALHDRVEAGDTAVALGFARRTEGGEREGWLRLAAEAGDPWAAVELAEILRDRGEEGSALPYLERAAEAGSAKAAARLGSLLRDRAEHWLRTAAEAGEAAAAHELGDMVVGDGREDEALRWYRRAAALGRREVAASLGTILSTWRDPEAEMWLRYGTEWGDPRSAGELAVYLSWQVGPDDPEVGALLRQAALSGDPSSLRNLGKLLEHEGLLDEAMRIYRRAQEGGALDAEQCIGDLLRKQGKHEEAEEWLRKAADANPTGIPETLAPPPHRTPTPAPDTVKE